MNTMEFLTMLEVVALCLIARYISQLTGVLREIRNELSKRNISN
jgi:hypothetical protein